MAALEVCYNALSGLPVKVTPLPPAPRKAAPVRTSSQQLALIHRLGNDFGNGATWGGIGQSGLAAVGAKTTDASQMLRSGSSYGAAMMGMLRNNAALRITGKVGRSDAVGIAGDVLLGVGAAIGAWQNYSADRADNGIAASVAMSAVQTAGDAVISYTDVTIGVEVGATIGLAIGPEGALIGAGIGAAVGGGIAFFESNAFNSGVDTVSHVAGRAVSDVANFFGL